MNLISLVACLIVLKANAFVLDDAQIYRTFASHEVVPDVIDEAPDCWAKISFKSGRTVEGGNKLTPTQVKTAPIVAYNPRENALYTLIMTDPDAPSRDDPKHKEFVHWIVGNIPGSDIERGETIVEYLGAASPKGTGLHRFVFLVYEQKEKIDFTNEPKISNRCRNPRRYFSTKTFARKYDMVDLYAGNFFQAHYDDYVPVILASLSECIEK